MELKNILQNESCPARASDGLRSLSNVMKKSRHHGALNRSHFESFLAGRICQNEFLAGRISKD